MARILLVWLLSVLPALAAVSPGPRPNVLFILVDDYGIKDVGIEGSTFYETPHIDTLARSGMRFTQGYAACQVCSPSRASILLGRYPTRHGITDWIGAGVGEAFARERHVRLLTPDYVRNLPAEETRTSQLWSELQAWLKETGAKVPQPNPEYTEAMADQNRKEAQALKTRLEKEHAAHLDPAWQPDPSWWKSLVPGD